MRFPAWVRKPSASGRTRLGQSPWKLPRGRRPWDQCPRPYQHGSGVRQTWYSLSESGIVWQSKRPEADLLDVVHGGDGLLGILFVGVPNETKTPTATSVAVFDDNLCRMLSAISFTRLPHVLKSNTSNKQGVKDEDNINHGKKEGHKTYCFLHHAELLKFLSQSCFLCVPCKATVSMSAWLCMTNTHASKFPASHPMNNFDILSEKSQRAVNVFFCQLVCEMRDGFRSKGEKERAAVVNRVPEREGLGNRPTVGGEVTRIREVTH